MGTKATVSAEAGKAVQPARRSCWKVFALTYALLLLIIAMLGGVIRYSVRGHIRRALQEEITRNLTQKAQMLANRINTDHAHGIDVITSQEGQAAGARATVVDTNGKAIADSEVAASSLEGEGRLPEFAAALHGSTGVEVRTQNGVQVLLVAVPVSGGAVRLAYPLSDLDIETHHAASALLVACVIAAVAGALLAAVFSRVFTSS